MSFKWINIRNVIEIIMKYSVTNIKVQPMTIGYFIQYFFMTMFSKNYLIALNDVFYLDNCQSTDDYIYKNNWIECHQLRLVAILDMNSKACVTSKKLISCLFSLIIFMKEVIISTKLSRLWFSSKLIVCNHS